MKTHLATLQIPELASERLLSHPSRTVLPTAYMYTRRVSG